MRRVQTDVLCVIIMFDLTQHESLERAKLIYYPEISLLVNKSKCFFVLLGNKSDQIAKRQVSQEEVAFPPLFGSINISPNIE